MSMLLRRVRLSSRWGLRSESADWYVCCMFMKALIPRLHEGKECGVVEDFHGLR
jgi:hypothetical protein